MVDVIDVHDLPEEDIKKIQELVEKLREKKQNEKFKDRDELKLRSWPMGAKGTISRKEIYEDI